MTKPVIYECYPNKDELLLALLDREERRLLEAITESLPTNLISDNVEAVLAAGLTAFLAGAGQAPNSWRVVFDSGWGSGSVVASRVRRVRETVVGQLRELVSRYMAAGEVDDIDRKAPVVAELIASVSESCARMISAGAPPVDCGRIGDLCGQDPRSRTPPGLSSHTTERALSVTASIDPSIAMMLLDASIESYYALDPHDPAHCNPHMVTPPTGYDLVDCWTGVDSVFNTFSQVECFGVVFRSQSAPYSYVFSFRGTYSLLDALDDLEFWEKEEFVPLRAPAADANVSYGFWSIYSGSVAGTRSMQEQLFSLLDKYQSSAEPIHRLFVTGHSLGAALCELFTLDLALSPYRDIPYSNYNYACPQVGDAAFAQLYDSQRREKDPATRTLRIQNTYDIVPCTPPTEFGYQHVGDAYLVAFYNKDAGYLDPLAKLYDHQALNYQAVLACAFSSPGGVCINDNLPVSTDAETLASGEPDPSTLCWFGSESQSVAAPAVDSNDVVVYPGGGSENCAQ